MKTPTTLHCADIFQQVDCADGGNLQPQEAEPSLGQGRIFSLETRHRNVPRKSLEHHPWTSNVSFFKLFMWYHDVQHKNTYRNDTKPDIM